jgi:hypothetical protein
MSIKANQIKVENDKLVIGGQVNGVNDVGRAMSSHADSQLTFSLDATGTPGIKLTLKDATIHGASTAVANQNSQIEAGSIGTDDIADGAIDGDKIADDSVSSNHISGADGAAVAVTYDYTGVTAFQVKDPTNPTDAANKRYVDDKAQGLDFKDSVLVGTTTYLDASYLSGVITATNQEVLTIDGVTVAVGDRILVKDGLSVDAGVNTDLTANGIYVVSTLGVAGTTEWELTRADDFNQDSEVTSGAYVLVTAGTANQLTAYVLQSDSGDDPTLDTSDLSFVAFSGSATSVAGGDGISVAGTTVSVDLNANSGLEFVGAELAINPHNLSTQINGNDELAVKLGGTNQSLAYGTAANDGADGLIVKVDDTSVRIGADGLKSAVLTQGENTANRNAVTGNSVGDTGIVMVGTPANNSMVFVFINGIMMRLGDGTTTGADVFFIPSASTNLADVRDIADIVNGDKLYFAANIAGFDLENSDDVRIVVQSVPSI